MITHNKTAICTISSANFFPFAKTLLQSVERFHPECDRFFLLVDKIVDDIVSETGFTAIRLDDLHIPSLPQMSFAYDIVELNTAVKPFLLSYLLKKGYRKVIYLDPDIRLYSRIDLALKSLDSNSVVLTPHSVHPAPAATSLLSQIQWEKNMLTTGVFNLGFIGISKKPEVSDFLLWWQNRCQFLCFNEPYSGIFVDQKWAELAIAYLDHACILRDPGYNVSVWNLHGRSLKNGRINGKNRLVFYHFSSIDIRDDSFLSRHDKTITFYQHPELRALYADYRRLVIENGYEKFRTIPYRFGRFADGKEIDVLERRLYCMVAADFADPFQCTRKGFYKSLPSRPAPPGREKPSVAVKSISAIARIVFKAVGPKSYRNLTNFFSKSAQLRAHTFLLQ